MSSSTSQLNTFVFTLTREYEDKIANDSTFSKSELKTKLRLPNLIMKLKFSERSEYADYVTKKMFELTRGEMFDSFSEIRYELYSTQKKPLSTRDICNIAFMTKNVANEDLRTRLIALYKEKCL